MHAGDSRLQTFIDADAKAWMRIDLLPGVELLPLAQPVPEGPIHRAASQKAL